MPRDSVIPDHFFGVVQQIGNGLVPVSTLNAVADRSNAQQVTVAGDGDYVPICYGGPVPMGSKVAAVNTWTNGYDLLVLYIICRGEIGGLFNFQVNGATPSFRLDFDSWTGTTSQPADWQLAAAYAAQGKSYTDNLPGIAWVRVRCPPGEIGGFPQFACHANGLKLYDPRKDSTVSGGSGSHRLSNPATWEWSDNPSLALADFLRSSEYGCGRSVDWTSVITAANANDALVGGEKKRTIAVSFNDPTPVISVVQTLRTYAGCWLAQSGDYVKLVPDVPGASVMTFDSSNIIDRTFAWDKRGIAEQPTIIDVWYTDTTTIPARQVPSEPARLPGVDAGTLPIRRSRVNLPGITRASQAYREAVERLNHLSVEDLSISFTADDSALAIEIGDIITVSSKTGITNKLFRVAQPVMGQPGRWQIKAQEYDPASYSSAVVTTPTYVDTNLPLPSEPIPPTGLVVTEENYQLQNDLTATRFALSWVLPAFPFVQNFYTELVAGGEIIYTGQPTSTSTAWRSPPVQEGVTYTVNVYTVSTSGAISTAATTNITSVGKALPPDDVPSFDGFEVGGVVKLSWGKAVNDVWRYEVRYSELGGSPESTGEWDDAEVLDIVDGLRLTTNEVPSGRWRFFIRSVDSVGNYSVGILTKDLTVTSDANSFLLSSRTFTSPTLTYMTEENRRPDPRRFWVTDHGDALNYGHAVADDSVGTFDDLLDEPFASPQSAGASIWESEVWEPTGAQVSGTFTATIDLLDVDGTAAVYIDLSDDGVTWRPNQVGASRATISSGRYVRLRVQTDGVMLISGEPSIRIDAVARSETIVVTTSAAGPTKVYLSGIYSKVKSINGNAVASSGGITVTFDNISVGQPGYFAEDYAAEDYGGDTQNSFDVYAFDVNDDLVAVQVYIRFEGI